MLTKCHSGDPIKKNEMGEACGTYGGEDRCIQGFGGGNLSESARLENPGLKSRIILKRILKN